MAVASPEQYLADLNPPQREAVLATEGPLLVIAGAGSGKTRVLTYRVAHLINAVGAKPNEILAITFTNKAAGEMRERLERLLGRSGRGLWILTFHAACGRILRREAQRLGYRSNFTIYDQADQIRLVKQCLEELERDPKRFTPRGIHNQISHAKNRLISPDEYANQVQSFYDQTVADVYQVYQRRLFASNAVDFDDLLMLTVDVLERFPDVREKWQKAFRYILVDEYQDTNHAQYRLLQLLAEKHHNVCAVGDPDQCVVAGTPITMADGTTKPIEDVRVGDQVLSCYGSGRFGPAQVTRRHRSSRRAGVAITTQSGRRIVSTPEHTHFAGFKSGKTPQRHMKYPTEARARASETLLSLKYQLPTLPFVARPYQGHEGRSLVADQGLIDQVFAGLDTEAAGRQLLREQGLSFEHPHFSAATTTSGGRVRRRLTVTLCGDPRGSRTLHRLSLFGYDDEGRRALEKTGLPIRPAYKGSTGWRVEAAHSDFSGLIDTVER